MSETNHAAYARGYNAGYRAGVRRSEPRTSLRRNRVPYSDVKHERLLSVASERWTLMNERRKAHGRDVGYFELRAQMVEAHRAVSEYMVETGKDRTQRGLRSK